MIRAILVQVGSVFHGIRCPFKKGRTLPRSEITWVLRFVLCISMDYRVINRTSYIILYRYQFYLKQLPVLSYTATNFIWNPTCFIPNLSTATNPSKAASKPSTPSKKAACASSSPPTLPHAVWTSPRYQRRVFRFGWIYSGFHFLFRFQQPRQNMLWHDDSSQLSPSDFLASTQHSDRKLNGTTAGRIFQQYSQYATDKKSFQRWNSGRPLELKFPDRQA